MEDSREAAQTTEEQRAAEERLDRLAALAKDVVLVLVKTLKATGMYLPNNPIYKRFHEELARKFAAYFDLEDRLSLRINRFELTFLDREVYKNPDKEANIALMFFKDGVREICFHKGIDSGEINGLMDILKFNAEERALDDDLVTLMWEKDFTNITYTVVEDTSKEESEEEEALLRFDEEPEAIRQIEELRALARRQAEKAAGEAQETAGAARAAQAPAHGMGYVPALEGDSGSDGYESIRGTYPAPDDIALLTELTDIFYEILVTETDMEKFAMVADSLTRALDIFVSRGDLALSTILVMKVQELIASGRLSGEALGIINGVLDRASSDTVLKKVGQFIDESGTEALESAGSYLSQLDERAAGPMVGLLETLKDRKSRRTLCDIIPGTVKGSCRPLVPHLRHRYWYVARNIAMILGRMGDREAVRPLGSALKNEEPRVRKEAVVALAAIGGDEAAGFMETALDDEVRVIRSVATRLLAELDPERAYLRLMEISQGKDFKDRDFDEKKEILETIGRTGKQAAFEYLSGLFKKKGLFGGAKRDMLRACAAYGLAAVGGEEALALLKSETGSKSKALRAACAQCVRHLESRRA